MQLKEWQAALARALVAEQITREEFNAEMNALERDDRRGTVSGGTRTRRQQEDDRRWAGYPLTWGDEG